MKCLAYMIMTLTLMGHTQGNDFKARLKVIDHYIHSDLDSAILLSEQLLRAATIEEDYFGIVKANLYLGYFYEQKDYAKSTIYYLEGIRQADNGKYPGIAIDQIWLRRNLANVYRRFNTAGLATKYNMEAIQIAQKARQMDQVIDLKFNQGLVYQNNGQTDEAIQIFSEVLPLLAGDLKYTSEVINQIGLVYLENGKYKEATGYFEQLLSLPENLGLYSARAWLNLGEVFYNQGETLKSIECLKKSIKFENIVNLESSVTFLYSYRNMGRYLFELGKLGESKSYLHKAESIFKTIGIDDNEAYKGCLIIFKYLSDVYYKTGDQAKGGYYAQVYFDKMQAYLNMQEDLQRKEKEFNLELITQRYFDSIEKQERMASILFWFKTTSFSMISLFILIISLMKYNTVKTRREIELSLRKNNILE